MRYFSKETKMKTKTKVLTVLISALCVTPAFAGELDYLQSQINDNRNASQSARSLSEQVNSKADQNGANIQDMARCNGQWGNMAVCKNSGSGGSVDTSKNETDNKQDEQIETLTSQSATQHVAIKSNTSGISLLKNDQVTLSMDLKNVESQNEDQQGIIESNSSNISELNTKQKVLSNNVKKNSNNIESVSNVVQNNTSSISDLSTHNSLQDTKISNNKETITFLGKRVQTLNGRITGLEQRIDQVENTANKAYTMAKRAYGIGLVSMASSQVRTPVDWNGDWLIAPSIATDGHETGVAISAIKSSQCVAGSISYGSSSVDWGNRVFAASMTFSTSYFTRACD